MNSKDRPKRSSRIKLTLPINPHALHPNNLGPLSSLPQPLQKSHTVGAFHKPRNNSDASLQPTGLNPLKQSSPKAQNSDILGADINEIYPEWLTNRQDFVQKYNQMKKLEYNDLAKIVETPLAYRSEDEKRALYNWMCNSEFFKSLPHVITKDLCDTLSLVRVRKNTKSKIYVVIVQGSVADCLYVLYAGRVSIYLNNERIAHYEDGSFFGELALDKQCVRLADAIAECDCILFKLKDIDYKSIVFSYKSLEKHSNLRLLMNVSYFANVSYIKIQNIINSLAVSTFSPGDIIYDYGSQSHSFYIVKSGEIELQTNLEIEKVNKWPIGLHLWNERKIKSKYACPIKLLKEGDWFGEFELIAKTERKTRAVCVETATCLAMGVKDFERIATGKHDAMANGISLRYSEEISAAEAEFIKSIYKNEENHEILFNSVRKNTKKAEMIKEAIKVRKEMDSHLLKKRVIENVMKDKVRDLNGLRDDSIGLLRSFDSIARKRNTMVASDNRSLHDLKKSLRKISTGII